MSEGKREQIIKLKILDENGVKYESIDNFNVSLFRNVYYEAFQMGLVPPWADACGQFEVIDGDYEIMPGISLVTLPGHTPGSQGVLVECESGNYLISSDFMPYYYLWEDRKFGYPVASGINTSIIEFYDSIKKAVKLTDRILPAHDFRVLEKAVYK